MEKETHTHTKPIEHFRWTEICFGNNSWWDDLGSLSIEFLWLVFFYFTLEIGTFPNKSINIVAPFAIRFNSMWWSSCEKQKRRRKKKMQLKININGNRVVYHQFRWKNSIQLTECRCLFVRNFFFIPIFFLYLLI